MGRISADKLSRPPLERMLFMHERIRAKKFPNCPFVAKHFEVSTRTIKRDIEFMQCRLNLPIDYDNRRYGYYYTKPVEHFPHVSLTEGELFSLLVAKKAIEQYRGSPFHQPLESAFSKISSQLGEQLGLIADRLDQAMSFHPFAPDASNPQLFGNLYSAIQNHTVTKIGYRNLGQKTVKVRKIHPYHLACVDNRWYLIALDAEKSGIRNFLLPRIQTAEATDETFIIPKSFDIERHLKGGFGIFQDGGEYHVSIRFDAWASELIQERLWHPSQVITPLSQGELRLEVDVKSLIEIERWVLSWGDHATVEVPNQLIESIREKLDLLADRYQFSG
jgi:predicted DNA-binding transcriptional regulator YafY